MAATTVASAGVSSITREQTAASAISAVPWYVWCAVLAVTSVMIGGHWDISWHSTIGRDTFWTPAHIAIYMCGVLAGVAFGYIILFTTFSKTAPLAPYSVHIWGFRAPLGAFIASWGGITMLASAPFDNWWHDAYGLDVKIVSPPHILLFIGIYGVMLGTVALIAGHMNRASGAQKNVFRWIFIYVCGLVLDLALVILEEYTDRIALHTVLPYVLMAFLTPAVLVIASRVTGWRYAATAVAGIHMLMMIGLILVLPLFPAEPKLGPVYQNVTFFIPPQFPMLLIVPAFVLDWILNRWKAGSAWKTALIAGFAYVATLMAAEWPFASFLMSPAARNAFFGTGYFTYGTPPNSYLVHNMFLPGDSSGSFVTGLLIAIAAATMMARWGLSRSEWLKSVKR